MAKYSVEGDSITLIKNAIAAKTGDSGTLTFPNDFADAVSTLPPVQTGTSKTYTPGASEQSESFGDSIHVDSVTVKAIPSSYIVPSGSKSITANGTHDVTSVASAVVNVPVPSGYYSFTQYNSGEFTVSSNSQDYDVAVGFTPKIVAYFYTGSSVFTTNARCSGILLEGLNSRVNTGNFRISSGAMNGCGSGVTFTSNGFNISHTGSLFLDGGCKYAWYAWG